MIGNFVRGILWGGLVAVIGLAAVSTLMPVATPHFAEGDSPSAQSVEAQATSEAKTDDAATGTVSSAAQAADPKAAEKASGKVQSEPTPVATVPTAPVAPNSDANLSLPASEGAEAAAPSTEVPTAPLAAANAPASPAPVLPLAPKAGASVPAPSAPESPGTMRPATAPAAEAAPAGVSAPAGLPAAKAGEPAPTAPELPPAPQPETQETLLTPTPPAAKNPAPAKIVLDDAPDAPAALEQDAKVTETAPKDLPKVLDLSKPATLAPSAGLNAGDTGVTDSKLPQIGIATKDVATAPPEDNRPIVLYARSFSNDAGKPAFAVVLRDTGADDLDRAQLAALPFPISFVIDPADRNAKAAAAIYRAAGQEVVMLATGIPNGATAADLEQTFQANATVLPEAVAVMDTGLNGFQDDRPLASLVVPVIGEQGRGVLTFDQGLNAADQVARRNKVPAAVIFRDLDAGGEDVEKIRRYLDRAAFKAAQEGRVVVVGSTRPETIQALMEWTVEGRASSVALAPLTAVMQVN